MKTHRCLKFQSFEAMLAVWLGLTAIVLGATDASFIPSGIIGIYWYVL